MEILFENIYGRTLIDSTDEVYCSICEGWCKAEECPCSECRDALEEYRASLQSEDMV